MQEVTDRWRQHFRVTCPLSPRLCDMAPLACLIGHNLRVIPWNYQPLEIQGGFYYHGLLLPADTGALSPSPVFSKEATAGTASVGCEEKWSSFSPFPVILSHTCFLV